MSRRDPVQLVVKLLPRGRQLLGPVLAHMPGQMTIEDYVDAVSVEPCPECSVGKCGNCDGRTLDHERDEIVPCPCRAAGHTPKEAA